MSISCILTKIQQDTVKTITNHSYSTWVPWHPHITEMEFHQAAKKLRVPWLWTMCVDPFWCMWWADRRTDRQTDGHWPTAYTTLCMCCICVMGPTNNKSIDVNNIIINGKNRNSNWYAHPAIQKAAPLHVRLLAMVTGQHARKNLLALRWRLISLGAEVSQISRSSGGTFSVDSKSIRDPCISWRLGLYVPRLALFTPTAMATVTQASTSVVLSILTYTRDDKTDFHKNEESWWVAV